jgi:hypothetical protein
MTDRFRHRDWENAGAPGRLPYSERVRAQEKARAGVAKVTQSHAMKIERMQGMDFVQAPHGRIHVVGCIMIRSVNRVRPVPAPSDWDLLCLACWAVVE